MTTVNEGDQKATGLSQLLNTIDWGIGVELMPRELRD